MNDPFGRTIDYLRISVTDRCNERCLYCMPEGYRGWAQRSDHLTSDEILRTVEAATRMGFTKFRVTGGEPLVRSDIVDLLARIWELPGVQTLGLSTNGTLLAKMAAGIRRAGVRSVNISLDALDAVNYTRITGGDLRAVMAGFEAALEQDFEVVKLNCVLLRGVNDHEALSLAHFAARHGCPIRFIELMPISGGEGVEDSRFISVQAIMNRFANIGSLVPLTGYRPGQGPAKYYDFLAPGMEAPAKVGFIGALTTPHFCETCNKLRLTADGKLRPCLGRVGEIDLLQPLRAGVDPTEVLGQAIANKPEDHPFLEQIETGRPMTAIGG